MNMPTFDPPGPGPWEPDGAHFPKPFPTGVRVDGGAGEITVLS